MLSVRTYTVRGSCDEWHICVLMVGQVKESPNLRFLSRQVSAHRMRFSGWSNLGIILYGADGLKLSEWRLMTNRCLYNADTVLTYTIVILVIIIIKSTVFKLVKSSRAVNRVYWDFWFDLTRQIALEDVISFSIFRKFKLFTPSVIAILHSRLRKAFVRRVTKEPRCRLLSRKWSGI
jgi:hypothetical protein